MYYVYMLRCSDDSLYTGITTDPARRLAEHQGRGGKGARYMRLHAPQSIAALWSATDRATAQRLEYRLKALDHRQKEALLAGDMSVDNSFFPLPEGCQRLSVAEVLGEKP